MKTKPSIKVVKRAERERQAEALVAEKPASIVEIEQEKERNAVMTITSWIDEQQEPQNPGGARANFDDLFAETNQ
ncbi:MAG: hypothetical protein ABI923_00675 [bacterium]